jgi:predicted DNA-binding protein
MIRGPKKSVGVLMPLEMYECVKVQAREKGKSIPGYIRQVLRCYLWHVENAPEALTGKWKII